MNIPSATIAPHEIRDGDVPFDPATSDIERLLASLKGWLCDFLCEVDRMSRERGTEHVAWLCLAENPLGALYLPIEGVGKYRLDAVVEGIRAAAPNPAFAEYMVDGLLKEWRPGRVKTVILGPRSTEVRVLAVVPYAVGGDA